MLTDCRLYEAVHWTQAASQLACQVLMANATTPTAHTRPLGAPQAALAELPQPAALFPTTDEATQSGQCRTCRNHPELAPPDTATTEWPAAISIARWVKA